MKVQPTIPVLLDLEAIAVVDAPEGLTTEELQRLFAPQAREMMGAVKDMLAELFVLAWERGLVLTGTATVAGEVYPLGVEALKKEDLGG